MILKFQFNGAGRIMVIDTRYIESIRRSSLKVNGFTVFIKVTDQEGHYFGTISLDHEINRLSCEQYQMWLDDQQIKPINITPIIDRLNKPMKNPLYHD